MSLRLTHIPTSQKQFVLQLFKEAAQRIKYMNIDHWQYWHNPPAEKLKWMEEGLENREFFFIELKGEKAGMVRILEEDLLYWGEQAEKALYVHSLVIKNAFSGKGLGEQTLATIAERAKNAGCRYLRLDADAHNPKLCRYYEQLGFRQVGQKQLPISTYKLYQREV